MSCCNLLTLVLAALTSYFILFCIPTTPSSEELMRIQKRRQLLRLKAGVYKGEVYKGEVYKGGAS